MISLRSGEKSRSSPLPRHALNIVRRDYARKECTLRNQCRRALYPQTVPETFVTLESRNCRLVGETELKSRICIQARQFWERRPIAVLLPSTAGHQVVMNFSEFIELSRADGQ